MMSAFLSIGVTMVGICQQEHNYVTHNNSRLSYDQTSTIEVCRLIYMDKNSFYSWFNKSTIVGT